MRPLTIAALSTLMMLLLAPFSEPEGCVAHSIGQTPLMVNLDGAGRRTNFLPHL
jgi:hypothetical protein